MTQEFFAQVPRTRKENLAYRVDLRERASKDPGFQKALMVACQHDVLFWLSAFCFLYEPRDRLAEDGTKLPHQIPMIPWEHQIQPIITMRENLGSKDIIVVKSRGEGMSWIAILLALHDWLFDPMSKVGVVSSTEDKADDASNMDSILQKGVWELSKLPKWMVPVYNRNQTKHTLVNKETDAEIAAFAATGDAGRSGRYKWFMCDEIAFWNRPDDSDFLTSVQGSTDSRLLISTPNGPDGAYYRKVQEGGSAVRISLHWSQNPSKNRGLYTFEKGKPVAVDPLKNPLDTPFLQRAHRGYLYNPVNSATQDLFGRLEHKGFRLDNHKLRSPWYDAECDRAEGPKDIAQELDLDFGGSVYRYFTQDVVEKADKSSLKPIIQGALTFHPETLEPTFGKVERGPFHLWVPLDAKFRPPQGAYAVGADVAAGLGGSATSNSVCQVLDLLTMEQVAEFAVNTMDQSEFADFCIAVAKMFHNAYLNWETNGPGEAFTKRVKERQYGNVYYRNDDGKRGKAKGKALGWRSSPGNKERMFNDLLHSLRTGSLTIRSKALAMELPQYVRVKGKIAHNGAINTADESQASEAHGDRVIAFGVCLMSARDRPLIQSASTAPPEKAIPPHCIGARDKAHERLQQERDDVWDDRTNWDMAQGNFSVAV